MSNEKPFEILVTEDGSPTLKVSGREPMHSPAGALSETLYIYGPTVEWALTQPQPCIHSVGLGLGYNELLCYGVALTKKIPVPTVVSYEAEPLWIHNFKNWLQENGASSSIYNDILGCLSTSLSIEASELKNLVRHALQENHLVLGGALQMPFSDFPKANGILYDAYCGLSDPHLWEEDFLDQFLTTVAAPNCQLATYAAKGILNRTLKAHGFQVTLNDGFGKKRNSTRAQREK